MITDDTQFPLLGHKACQQRLKQAFDDGRPHHGLILSGVQGIGKRRLACQIAAWVQSRPETPSLFGELTVPEIWETDPSHEEARLVFNNAHPDVKIISSEDDEATKSGQIKVDTIRTLGRFLGQTPARGGWRIAIIDTIDAVNRNGANAMLKMLEEPPDNAMIILLTNRLSAVLPTIKSRCSIARLSPLDHEDTLSVLGQIWPEGDRGQLDILASLCEGAPGQAHALQLSGAVELFEQSCLAIASSEFQPDEIRKLADSWGAGGKVALQRRNSALYLFEKLLHASAISATGMASQKHPLFEVDSARLAISALTSRHSANRLARLHADCIDKISASQRLYLDLAPIMFHFFQEMHSQQH